MFDRSGSVDPMSNRAGHAFVVVVCAVMLAGACASSTTAEPATSTTAVAAVLVGPDEFARRVEDPQVVTINVHVPNEGNIAGTDLEIPFDQVATSTELPTDLSTPIAVYCRSGNMSASAVRALEAKGYSSIAELDGGSDAWLRTGRTLEDP
jgi:rhodanese-related sulfurtransferase